MWPVWHLMHCILRWHLIHCILGSVHWKEVLKDYSPFSDWKQNKKSAVIIFIFCFLSLSLFIFCFLFWFYAPLITVFNYCTWLPTWLLTVNCFQRAIDENKRRDIFQDVTKSAGEGNKMKEEQLFCCGCTRLRTTTLRIEQFLVLKQLHHSELLRIDLLVQRD